jgi:hypothetical protein
MEMTNPYVRHKSKGSAIDRKLMEHILHHGRILWMNIFFKQLSRDDVTPETQGYRLCRNLYQQEHCSQHSVDTGVHIWQNKKMHCYNVDAPQRRYALQSKQS